MMIDINRGNRFTQLVSYSTKAKGLHEHIVKLGGADHPNAKVNFKLGDVVTTMISTTNKETILLQHDTNLPRPYSLGFRVQGTKGIWMDVNKSIYIEGQSAKPHQWEDAKAWLDKYDHPLWKKIWQRCQRSRPWRHGLVCVACIHRISKTKNQHTTRCLRCCVWVPLHPYLNHPFNWVEKV